MHARLERQFLGSLLGLNNGVQTCLTCMSEDKPRSGSTYLTFASMDFSSPAAARMSSACHKHQRQEHKYWLPIVIEGAHTCAAMGLPQQLAHVLPRLLHSDPAYKAADIQRCKPHAQIKACFLTFLPLENTNSPDRGASREMSTSLKAMASHKTGLPQDWQHLQISMLQIAPGMQPRSHQRQQVR
jgi:hypothetical protein